MTYPKLWRRLTPRYINREAQAIVRLLLEERYGLSLTDLYSDKVTQLSANDAQELEKMMQRFEKGEPVQYVLGTATFCGRTFHVAPGVLIPRPETEGVVRGVRSEECGVRILDIGTGSGCIAITLALENPDAYVEALDISEEALAIARDNAERLGAKVEFKKVDILNPSPALPKGEGGWSTIISNPPYICEKEREDMEANVLDYEPATALFVPDDDPLLFYRHIADYALIALQPNGQLLFETNPLYINDVAAMLREKGFADITLQEDCFGKFRFVMCTQPTIE
jgi:release factor glutamine methyltransferase